MFQAVLPAFALILSVLVAQCDIGNIGDYVNTYKVTVTNAGDQNAFVTIVMPDSKETVLALPADTVAESGFQGGEVAIFVTPYDLAGELELYRLRAQLVEKAHNPKLDNGQVKALWDEINGIQNRISAGHFQGQPGAGRCTTTLSTKKPVAAVATFDQNRWVVSC